MTFLEDVLYDIGKKNLSFSDLVFILPSKRSGIFLKYFLGKTNDTTIFAPEILSIEDFVLQLSELHKIKPTEVLFHFYNVYTDVIPKEEVEPFETFSNWAQIILQDFNEIDRYLVSSDKVLDYLSAIKELDHWSKASQQTPLVSNYLKFWKHLKTFYHKLTTSLIEKQQGYQGLIYREAVQNVETYIQNIKKKHIFIGFNALNTAEERIIQDLLHNDLAYIYWDIDNAFMNYELHGANLFIKAYKQKWPYFTRESFKWRSSYYKTKKSIQVIGCLKSIGQSKYVGHILEQLARNNSSLNNTAVVLGDERLLVPLLNSLPKSIQSLNVTMGLPLKTVPLASLFEQLFKMHKTGSDRFYFKDVMAILSHQMVQPLLASSQDIIRYIKTNNLVYLTTNMLKKYVNVKDEQLITLLFDNWGTSIDIVMQNCIRLIYKMKDALSLQHLTKAIELEYVFRFYTLFNELSELNSKYPFIDSISSFQNIFNQLLSTERLDFQGEPLGGLQVMGVLESRVLDFETVIITSVNEGILPAGKTTNSFIPFDVKKEHKLPTYKEKDAVYTYHFFRLLQRAKNVYILYDTEIDPVKGGEKSRFITQLEVEGIHDIQHKISLPELAKIEHKQLTIPKNEAIINSIRSVAEKGFSPSSLTNYIRNPIDFYYEKILGIKDTNEVEETVAANTLGTVIHKTLQDFYQPLEGRFITQDHLTEMKQSIADRIAYHFKDIFKSGDISKGKNMIIFEVAKCYILNFLDFESNELSRGNTIKIIASEFKVKTKISLPNLDYDILLKGEIDRIDEYNGVTRIIDYKSGKVLQSNLEVMNWDSVTQDYDALSKAFQVLMYTYILKREQNIKLPVEAGVISFKNLQRGFLKFAKKEAPRGPKQHEITEAILESFETQLKQLILEICNPTIAFIENELKP